MLATISQVPPRRTRRGLMGTRGRATLALTAVLAALLVATGQAFAQSVFDGAWSGTFVLTDQEGEQIFAGLVDLTIGAGGQIEGTAVGPVNTFRLIGAVVLDGSQVILNALPVSPQEHGATFSGSATLSNDGQELLMNLSSIPFGRLQGEIDVVRD